MVGTQCFIDWLTQQMISVSEQEVGDFEPDDGLQPGDEPLTQITDPRVKGLYIIMIRLNYELDEISRQLTGSDPDHLILEQARMVYEFQLDIVNHLFWGCVRHQLLQEDETYHTSVPLAIRADWIIVWESNLDSMNERVVGDDDEDDDDFVGDSPPPAMN